MTASCAGAPERCGEIPEFSRRWATQMTAAIIRRATIVVPRRTGSWYQRRVGRAIVGHVRCRCFRFGRSGEDRPDVGADWCNEPIAAPGQCFDELRGFSGIAKRLAHFLDRRIQPVLEVHERVALPQPFAQFFAGGNLARAFEQRREDLPGLLLQPDALTLSVKFARHRVELEAPEVEALPCRVTVHV